MRSFGPLFILLLAIISLSFSTFICHGARNSQDLPPPNVWIEMENEEAVANVGPGDDGLVNFQGTVHCVLPPEASDPTYVYVNLKLDAGGYSISSPPALYFKNEETRKFSFSIFVPVQGNQLNELNAGDIIQVRAQVSFEYQSSGKKVYLEDIYPCRVIVGHFSNLQIKRDVITDRTPVGEWRTATLYIMNNGNGNDTVNIGIEDRSRKMDVELDLDQVEAPYNGSTEFHIRMRQRSGHPGSNIVRIKAWSSVIGNANETHYDLPFLTSSSFKSFVTTPTQYLPVLSISLIILIVVVWAVLRSRLFPDEEEEKASEPERDLGPGPKPFKREKRPPKGLYKQTRNKRS